MDGLKMSSTGDNAEEKLVEPGEGTEKKVEIKYLASDSQNGETKIDMESMETAFVGMGKEELMKFANDPFWVRIRWFLFITFWLVWLVMLLGAIAIIILAPKCSAPKTPEWYEKSVFYKVDLKDIKSQVKDTSTSILKVFGQKLDNIKNIGFNAFLVDSLMESEGADHVTDFKKVDPDVGNEEELKTLLQSMKEKGMVMIMRFVPNYSASKHPWFIKSEAREEPFTNYYVWHNSTLDPDGKTVPPNNWMSVTGGSAWECGGKRGECYLHQFNKTQPDLNLRNKDLVEYFKGFFDYWLGLGIKGFYLDNSEYLLEDPFFRNEPINPVNPKGVFHDQYAFYSHRFTLNFPENRDILKEWSDHIFSKEGSLLMPKEMRDSDKFTQIFIEHIMVSPGESATDLSIKIEDALKSSSSVLEWECQDSSFCIDKDLSKGLQVFLLLLPSSSVVKSQEFPVDVMLLDPPTGNSTDPDDSRAYTNFVSILKAREELTQHRATTQLKVLNNTVVSYLRLIPGHKGYIVVFNVGREEKEVNLQEYAQVPGEVFIEASSHPLVTTSPTKVNGLLRVPARTSLVLVFNHSRQLH